MATQLTLDDHLAALVRGGAVLRAAAADAGLDTNVPTCPAWSVTDLVAHQGMVHRWAAANLRGDTGHDTAASIAAAKAADDLLGWYADGLAGLVDTLYATADDTTALVFLKDAPPARRFWARRQAHETMIHSVDAIAAARGRRPVASDVEVDPLVAADGIDELLTGFITRGNGQLHSDEPYALVIRTDDTGHSWTVRIGDGPIVTTSGATDRPDAVFTGTAVQLYLTLWNRADEITSEGRPEVLDQWRSNIRIRWS
jgi:uncharacterized protein (TIGR03083 family)